jgi:hypothetical protein
MGYFTNRIPRSIGQVPALIAGGGSRSLRYEIAPRLPEDYIRLAPSMGLSGQSDLRARCTIEDSGITGKQGSSSEQSGAVQASKAEVHRI